MPTCPKCNGRFPDDIRFCPEDGAPLVREADAPRAAGRQARQLALGQTGPQRAIRARITGPQPPKRHKGAGGAYEPGTILGAYRLQRMLGSGGMGRVYLAEHMRLGRKVAIKVLRTQFSRNPTSVRRFFNEAKAVNQISHENIVEITDFIEEEAGDAYYVMELLQGHSLAERLSREGHIPVERALGIAIQICDAFTAVHQAEIVHRDLKPDNVFLTERWGQCDFVKLLDFGIVKLAGELKVDGQTKPGTIIGTPEYMSPEQASGKAVDLRSDIYSLGVILYEMLSGRKPLAGKSLGELVIKHLSVEPKKLRKLGQLPQEISPRLEGRVMRCLEKDASKRPPSASVVQGELQGIASSEGCELDQFIATAYTKQPVQRRRRKGPLAALVVLGALVVAGVGLGLAVYKRKPPTPPPRAAPAPDPEVKILFDSVPRGAEIIRHGSADPLGRTPLTRAFERSERPITIEYRLGGYDPIRQQVSLAQDSRVVVSLVRSRAAPPPEKLAKKVAKKKRRKKKRRKKRKRSSR